MIDCVGGWVGVCVEGVWVLRGKGNFFSWSQPRVVQELMVVLSGWREPAGWWFLFHNQNVVSVWVR